MDPNKLERLVGKPYVFTGVIRHFREDCFLARIKSSDEIRSAMNLTKDKF